MSNVLTKKDFYDSAMAELAQYPNLAARIAVGDVEISQQIGAIAQMLAMVSHQIGVAEVEPWIKARDNMVLADAAARGILPMGKAATYEARIINHGNTIQNITAGRRLLDNNGRTWVVVNGASIPPQQNQIVHIQQYESKDIAYSVNEYKSFYTINVPPPEGNGYLLEVNVLHQDGNLFHRIERFNNVEPDQRVYHLFADESMNIYVQFGLLGKAGYIPNTGERITLSIKYTEGDVTLTSATPLDLEYISDGEEKLEILSRELVRAGAAPPDIIELREITGYPSLYDENAVFLGEFTFLLQRQMSPFIFLNVWNEHQEELVRSANIDNINCLFVSFLKNGIQKDEAQTQIKRIIATADNSYKVKFVDTIEQQITVSVSIYLAPMHDEAAVKQKVKLYLLNRYGKHSEWARKGGQRINLQQTVEGLRKSIIELQDGVSDINLTVSETQESRKPEHFRYVADSSIQISSTKLLGI